MLPSWIMRQIFVLWKFVIKMCVWFFRNFFGFFRNPDFFFISYKDFLLQMTKDKSSKMSYMYRTPFTTGHVFSASMIDTLLYQAFGKPYLIDFVRLLIGVGKNEKSGNLISVSSILIFWMFAKKMKYLQLWH